MRLTRATAHSRANGNIRRSKYGRGETADARLQCDGILAHFDQSVLSEFHVKRHRRETGGVRVCGYIARGVKWAASR